MSQESQNLIVGNEGQKEKRIKRELQKLWEQFEPTISLENKTRIMIGSASEPLFDTQEFCFLGTIIVPERYSADYLFAEKYQEFRRDISVEIRPFHTFCYDQDLYLGDKYEVFEARCLKFPVHYTQIRAFTLLHEYVEIGPLGNLLVLKQIHENLLPGSKYRSTGNSFLAFGKELEFDSEISVSKSGVRDFQWVIQKEMIQPGRQFLFFKKIQ